MYIGLDHGLRLQDVVCLSGHRSNCLPPLFNCRQHDYHYMLSYICTAYPCPRPGALTMNISSKRHAAATQKYIALLSASRFCIHIHVEN